MTTSAHQPEPSLQLILDEIREVREQGRTTNATVSSMQVAIEELREQGRATNDALATTRSTLEQRLDRLDQRVTDEVRSLGVLVEDTRSQSRAIIEAVEMTRTVLEHRIESIEHRLDRLDRETLARDVAFNLAIRGLRSEVQKNSIDIRDLKVHVEQNGADIRDLTVRVDVLNRIEERVTALERRSA